MDDIYINMTGIYGEEDGHVIDGTGLSGVRGYCSDEAAREIRSLLAPYDPGGLHFLDSGNFHYLSSFWLEKIDRPFDLLVFDHHTDMQRPAFCDLLSCGSWLLSVIEHHPYLGEVWLAGADESLLQSVDPVCEGRFHWLSTETIRESVKRGISQKGDSLSALLYPEIYGGCDNSKRIYTTDKGIVESMQIRTADGGSGEPMQICTANGGSGDPKQIRTSGGREDEQKQARPIYLSIDKDVLSAQTLATDWDQGTMDLETLLFCLSEVLAHRVLLGADVCGEPDPEKSLTCDRRMSRAINEQISRVIRQNGRQHNE